MAQQQPPETAVSRRYVIKAGGALALTVALPLTGCGGGSPNGGVASGADSNSNPAEPLPPGATQRARFLDEKQLDTLNAFVERMIPADVDPGAAAACCADAIDHLLAAFQTSPAFIYAGGPYSDRGGSSNNDFLNFVELDAYEELAWRIAIEGSQGLPEREVNGPVIGMQQIYTDGLAKLNELAAQQGAACFSEATAAAQDQMIGDADPAVQALLDIGFIDTMDAMYGAPEYGGNCDRLGWDNNGFDGDTHPVGYSDQQVVFADSPGPFDLLLPASYHDPNQRPPQNRSAVVQRSGSESGNATLPVAPSPEIMAGLMNSSGGSLKALQLAFANAEAASQLAGQSPAQRLQSQKENEHA